ncbi:hypothetical protein G6F56_000969 [Rhizopus delemar]|uniref:Receptor L-domain domain-containing protein n=1 Tax=Rhizopus stolonifer TaxID=4846 RepID=A0A367KQ54_RHIST|nr:hypothetical protein G6F56_000969 [Rhizopus delemar]RCI04301.1 hypothetical protein CU098_010750 [Rhizopus stolonifer]
MTRFSSSAIVLATLCATTLAAMDPACERTLKVLNQLDLDSIKHCKTFQGIITIDKMGTAPMLTMEGVENLKGDLLLSNNAELGGFSAPNLKTVEGQVKIENHTILKKVEFPQLTEVNSMTYSVLPALEVIQFPAGLTKVGSMKIEDTKAPKIDGFKPENIGTFVLAHNNYMQTFDFSSVKQATDMHVTGNNPEMVFNAPSLTDMQGGTFLNLGQLQMPVLTTVRSDFSLHDNQFTMLNLDSLLNIGGTFTVVNNNKLTEMSFKKLDLISGALSVGNNSQLISIEGFPSLKEIHGTLDLAGNFESYKLPALQDVRGGMRVQTTSSKIACSELERNLKGGNIVKGTAWSCSASMKEEQITPTVGQTPSDNTDTKITLGRESSSPLSPLTPLKDEKNGNVPQGKERESISFAGGASTLSTSSLGLAAVASLAYLLV